MLAKSPIGLCSAAVAARKHSLTHWKGVNLYFASNALADRGSAPGLGEEGHDPPEVVPRVRILEFHLLAVREQEEMECAVAEGVVLHRVRVGVVDVHRLENSVERHRVSAVTPSVGAARLDRVDGAERRCLPPLAVVLTAFPEPNRHRQDVLDRVVPLEDALKRLVEPSHPPVVFPPPSLFGIHSNGPDPGILTRNSLLYRIPQNIGDVSCGSGRTSIWSLRSSVASRHESRLLTLEVSNHNRLVVQAREKYIKLPVTKELSILKRWADLRRRGGSWVRINEDKAPGADAVNRHLILLGDSILDNAAYVPGGPAVVDQVRSRLPQGWGATLLARDGSVIDDVHRQLEGLPSDASHLVLSAGGNDVLREIGVLQETVRSVGEGLRLLAGVRDRFEDDYRRLLRAVTARGLPAVVCTVYDPCSPDERFQREAVTALGIFNDRIIRVARESKVPVVDLRAVCTEVADYANPIEPSSEGGARIAGSICDVVLGYDFSRRESVIFP